MTTQEPDGQAGAGQTRQELLSILKGEDQLYVPSAEAMKLAKDPSLIKHILADLDTRIKHDKAVKLSVFFTGLSAFLKEPINLFQKGESGIGKSYNTVQTLKYFPPDSVWLLGGISPKALIHDYGVRLSKDGKPLQDLEKPEKPRKRDYDSESEYNEQMQMHKAQMKRYMDLMRESYTLIELTGKVLVFLESPEFEAFRILYPILSHDTERIEYRFVDKLAKGQMRTTRVVIQGWPATIFLTVQRKCIEELATRSFTATPESSAEKIMAANQLTNQKASFPWQNENAETSLIREALLGIISWLKTYKAEVLIPFANLHTIFPKAIVRDMRDFQHFIQFLKAITALHLYQRKHITINGKAYLVATAADVAIALSVYSEIFETTRTGAEQALLSLYHNIVKHRNSWRLKELVAEYNAVHVKKVSSETLRVKMEWLSQIGYVNIEKAEDNRHINIYEPLIKEEKKPVGILVSETRIRLRLKLEKGLGEWLDSVSKNFELDIEKKNIMDGMDDIDDKDIQNFSLLFSSENLDIQTDNAEASESEKKPVGIQVSETRISLEFKTAKLERLSMEFRDKCAVCGLEGSMDWQATMHDGAWALLCGGCGFKLSQQLASG